MTQFRTKGCNETDVTDINSEMYNNNFPVYYNIEIYEDLGKSMLVSILDIFEKNPCTRLNMNNDDTLENFRREIANKILKIKRFWKEANLKRKCKNINEVIKEAFYDEFYKKNVFKQIFISTNKPKMMQMLSIMPSSAKASKKSPISLTYKAKETTTDMFKYDGGENTNEDECAEQDEEIDSKPLPKLVWNNSICFVLSTNRDLLWFKKSLG